VNPKEVILAFVEKINAHDVDGLCALMTDDHVFVDSDGTHVAGRETLRMAWATYLKWFPDYYISQEQVFGQGSVVAIFGRARGTYAGDGQQADRQPWEIPAAWKAVVQEERVAEWRVYANVDAVRRQMEEKAP